MATKWPKSWPPATAELVTKMDVDFDVDTELLGHVRTTEADRILAPTTSRIHVVEVQFQESAYQGSGSLKPTDIRQDEADDLPLPATILNAISPGRDSSLSAAVDVNYNLINQYSSRGNFQCETIGDDAFEMEEQHRMSCDALVLDSLIKGARIAGIWPKPETPYEFNFNALVTAI
ncbi:hypothetical protein BKA65DRAFT_582769 [Rhexocercosporidium sp. MPI-PUGE-AT-0058]|nr:hypothetical protein BKA65DRAFT_582769 [Rhexocercosporidium sp. MPI-PUGE-AT-0058]